MATLLTTSFRIFYAIGGCYLLYLTMVQTEALDLTPTCSALTPQKTFDALNKTVLFERLEVNKFKWIPLYMATGFILIFQINFIFRDLKEMDKEKFKKLASIWRHVFTNVISLMVLYMLDLYIVSKLFEGNGHFNLYLFKGSKPYSVIVFCNEGNCPKGGVDCYIWFFTSMFNYTVFGGLIIFFLFCIYSQISLIRILLVQMKYVWSKLKSAKIIVPNV